MLKPSSIGLIGLSDRPEVPEAINHMRKVLSEYRLESVLIDDMEWLERSGRQVDLLVSFGGDGAMLSLVSYAATHNIPLAGVNLGRLGFLTTCSMESVPDFARALAEGTYQMDCRSMLQAQRISEQGEKAGSRKLALNEVSLMRVETGKMVDLDAIVDGSLLNRYHADGILIATPTGSSAYSLSAGGPLVWPDADVLCVTPVCPHSLTNRAVVLPGRAVIELRPRSRRGRADSMRYSLDGRHSHSIQIGETLLVGKAAECLELIHLPHYNFPDLLRVKMRWQGAELP